MCILGCYTQAVDMKWNIALLICVLLFCTSCQGQHKPVALGGQVTEMSKNIWVTYKDKDGNYWFGSNGDGVYRYDGKSMLRYSVSNGLVNDSVREIKQDESGIMYFNTRDGISKFDGNKFTTLKPVKSKEWKLAKNDLWFTCNQDENGPYRYDGTTLYDLEFPKHYMEEDFYKRLPNAPFNPYQVYTTYKDRQGNMWFGTSTFGIYRYDGKSLDYMYEDHLTHIGENGSFGIRSIIQDKNGKFWFCNTKYRYDIVPHQSTEAGTAQIDYKREKGIDITEGANGDGLIYYQSVAEDRNGDLWLQTWGRGIWRYDGKKMHHYPVRNGTKDINVYTLYQDGSGGLWLNTPEHGAYKFDGKRFKAWNRD